MIRAGSGVVTGKRADEAALDATLQAMAASGVEHPDFALVFTTGDAYPLAHELLHAVRRVTGARAVIGASAAGVPTEGGEVEQVPAVGNGEFAPVGPTNFFHTYTGALVVFPEPADPAGPA